MGDHVSWLDRRCFADEDKKGSLKGVFRIVVTAQEPAADAQNHWAMAPQERLKSCFVTARNERFQQLSIGHPGIHLRPGDLAKMVDDGVLRSGGHETPSLAVKRLLSISWSRPRLYTFFGG
jgi:hypothetical protein